MRAALVAIAVLVALLAWQARAALLAEAELAQVKEAAATAQALQADRHALETARRIKVQSEVINAEVLRTQEARAAAGRAAAAHDSLLDELADLAGRARAAAADPSAAAEREAAAQATAVLADLLGQCSERRRELAAFADAAHIAGNTCQRSYEALTHEQP